MLRVGLVTALIVVILDQLTKALVLARFAGRAFAGDAITAFFNLVLTFNRGLSFGLFNTAPAGGRGDINVFLFSLVAAVIVSGLTYWLGRVRSPLLGFAIGLVIGGAVGNVVDRVRYGAVVDFLDFHIGSYHWPAFNLADSAICIGVAAMLFESLLLGREAH
ncbi:MAG: signal peptidase II [Alphaproteobacteria bacterium]|nr:signal peptidase II [Alphaproteobacteria bacterium]